MTGSTAKLRAAAATTLTLKVTAHSVGSTDARAERPHHRGVVDEHIDGPQLVVDEMDGPDDLAQIGQVRGHHHCGAAQMFYPLGGLSQLVLRAGHQRHGHPSRGELDRDRSDRCPVRLRSRQLSCPQAKPSYLSAAAFRLLLPRPHDN